MAKRSRKVKIKTVSPAIRRAREIISKYDVDKVDPNEYLDQSEDWSDLLNRIP